MPQITHEDVSKVYSGRQGCMCGCNGTYRDSDRSRKVMLTKILDAPFVAERFYDNPDSEGVIGCLYHNYETYSSARTQVVYVKESAGDWLDGAIAAQKAGA